MRLLIAIIVLLCSSRTQGAPRRILSNTCGRAEIKNSFDSRIFGGSPAIPNSWPWQVLYEERKACGEKDDEEGALNCLGVCGGTLIDDRHVLTAAHCIGTTDPSLITIIAGLHDKYEEEKDRRQILAVERIFKHEDYDENMIINDITILRLAEPVQFNRYVQPACLPGPDPEPGESVILIGWGALEMNGGPYHELKEAKVKVIGNCEEIWIGLDEEKQVCVGDPETGNSACQGDSGGPMLYEYNGQWIVSGVTSFVYAKACTTFDDSLPNVYVRVSAYLPWIYNIISS